MTGSPAARPMNELRHYLFSMKKTRAGELYADYAFFEEFIRMNMDPANTGFMLYSHSAAPKLP